jgi:hypothetical protein
MVLTWELMASGGEVLRDHYGFTAEDLDTWIQLTLDTARGKRKRGAEFSKALRAEEAKARAAVRSRMDPPKEEPGSVTVHAVPAEASAAMGRQPRSDASQE